MHLDPTFLLLARPTFSVVIVCFPRNYTLVRTSGDAKPEAVIALPLPRMFINSNFHHI